MSPRTGNHRLAIVLAMLSGVLWGSFTQVARSEETLAERRKRIESMSPQQKEQLRRCRQQFVEMEPAEREKMCLLHRQIQSDEDAQKLRRVMRRYYQWVKELPPYKRNELIELPPERRIAKIKQWRQEESDKRSRLPNPKDMEGFSRWLEEFTDRHEEQVMQRLPERDRQELEGLGQTDRRREIVGRVVKLWLSAKPGQRPPPPEGELAKLRSMLSDETRKRLEPLPPAEQWQAIVRWLRLRSVRRHRSGRGPAMPVSDEQLAYFFEHELSADARDRLLSLPGDQMREQLRKKYSEAKYPARSRGRPDRSWSRRPGARGGRPPNPGKVRRPHFPPPGPPSNRRRDTPEDRSQSRP